MQLFWGAPHLIIRGLYLINVVATLSQRRRNVVARRRNVVAIKNGSSDLIINPRTASLDFGLFIFCSKILVVWRLKQNHPRLCPVGQTQGRP